MVRVNNTALYVCFTKPTLDVHEKVWMGFCIWEGHELRVTIG